MDSVPSTQSPAAPPPELAGDRADAIARDVIEHPPQKQAMQQGSSRLRTAGLKVGGLLDRSVHGSENTEVGRVIDVMIGDDGKLAALELDVGGFLGVGNRRIAVAWTLFDVPKPTGTEPLRVGLTEEQVRSAPAAEESGNVTVVTGADMPPATARPAPQTPPEPAAGTGTTAAPAATGSSTQPAPTAPVAPAAPPADVPSATTPTGSSMPPPASVPAAPSRQPPPGLASHPTGQP